MMSKVRLRKRGAHAG